MLLQCIFLKEKKYISVIREFNEIFFLETKTREEDILRA